MRIFFTCVVLCLLIAGASISAFAQQFMGVSATYEHLPLQTFKASASFPFVFAEGRTIFINTVEYGYSVYDYDDWGFSQGSAGDTEQFHEVSYNLLFMQQLSQSWQMLVMPAVGLASDFEGDVSSDDATLIGKVIFIYTFSETFSLGPTAQLHFSKWVHLNLEGGYAFLRSFKFSDGLDEESSIDLDAKGYLKVSLQVGM